jgi:hypothetical protein
MFASPQAKEIHKPHYNKKEGAGLNHRNSGSYNAKKIFQHSAGAVYGFR